MSPGCDRGRPPQPPSTQASDPAKDLGSLSTAVYASGLDQAIGNADPWWSSSAATAIKYLASSAGSFDVDALLELVGRPPHPSYTGAALAAAWRSQVIRHAGCRVAGDGRLVRLWTAGPKTVRR